MNRALSNLNTPATLVECPRDAMQGWPHSIPVQQKIKYLNALLKVGFDTLDFGSFVSHKAIPQMADTSEVIAKLDMSATTTRLLAIVANERGAAEAVEFDEISYLGFPFSLSPVFQMRNTNSTMEESVKRVDAIQELCIKNNKQLVLYLSMGFGNPYGDPYNAEILLQWADVMIGKDIPVLSLADTVGLATAPQIRFALETLIHGYPETTIGVHLHATQDNWQTKAEAALQAGCKRFDGALKGIGGCPMAQDELVGNLDTSQLIPFLRRQNRLPDIDDKALLESLLIADEIFT